MRYLFLIAFAMSIPPLTDWLVDHQFPADGYSLAEVHSLDALVARSRTRAEEKADRIALYPTQDARNSAIASVFMEGR